MYHLRTHCRACGYAKPGAQGIKSAATENLIEVFSLGVQHLANDFCKDGEARAGCAPLKILYCPRCSLAQLSVVVDPEIMYAHYSYVTSPSAMMRDHFKELMNDIVEEAPHAKTVLEIGSNDGRLLSTMKSHGYMVQGVDPAENLAAIARAAGVPTTSGFFGEDMARTFPAQDIIIARHVFCHVDDWGNFIRGLEALCHKETLICIEVPYVGDMLNKCELDQCLPPGQKIVTDSGFLEIENVNIGQKVLTHRGTFEVVTNTFTRSYCGKVAEISIYGQNVPLVVTPEHPIFVDRNGQSNFIEARKLRVGDRLLKPVIREVIHQKTISVIHPGSGYKGISKTDFLVNESLAKIMGFYMAEGWYYECKEGCAQVEFAFGKSESEKCLAEECAKAILEFGAKANVRWKRFGWHVLTYGHMARLLHRELGTGAASKRVPSWMFLESKSIIENFLWAYIRGDGYVYRDGHYWRASTVSSQIAQGVALLANKLGFSTSVNFGKPLGLRRICKNPSWSYLTKPPIDILIRLKHSKKIKTYCDNDYQYGLLKGVTLRDYSGTVHNIEVDKDSSYVCAHGAVHNCYHEHLSFLSIKAMEHLLKGGALKIHRIKQYAIHGGAIVLMLRTTGTTAIPSTSVWTDDFTVDDWRQFSVRAKDQIDRLRVTVSTLVAQGKRVAGLGASAKSTVWINACGFTRREVAFISDNTPKKQYTFSPGTDIPIIDEGAILRDLPDYVILWAWNYRSEVLSKFATARGAGVKFIIPVPKIEVC